MTALRGPMRQHMRWDGRRYIPKKQFSTRQEAISGSTDPDLSPYKCEVCAYFHLGHLGKEKP